MDGGGKTPQCYNEIKKPSAYRVNDPNVVFFVRNTNISCE